MQPVPIFARDASDAVTIGQFMQIVRRHLLALLAVVGICLNVALGLYLAAPRPYRATATVDATPRTSSDVDPRADTAATERDVVLSRVVATRAAVALGKPTAVGDVRARTSVVSDQGSRILQITYRASSSTAASAGANAVASSYMAVRADMSRQHLHDHEAEVRSLLNAALQRLSLKGQTPAARRSDQTEVNRLEAQLNTIAWTGVNAATLVDPALPPRHADAPTVAVYVAGGIVIGLLLGVVIAVITDSGADLGLRRLSAVRQYA